MSGQLFTQYFLTDGIKTTFEWRASLAQPEEFLQFRDSLRSRYDSLCGFQNPNESVTEQKLIRPILELLGWVDYLSQPGTARNEDIPDHLLFENSESMQRAAGKSQPGDRFLDAVVVEESKRFGFPLDARDQGGGAPSRTPHGQILRYLSTAEIVSSGTIRWGILTNGKVWRLYDHRARPRADGYFEAELPEILKLGNENQLRLFHLLFRRDSFILRQGATTTFLEHALVEGKRYEEQVAQDLSGVVFENAFPQLVEAMAKATGKDLSQVRHAALIFLYRLLFVLYAEDRNLLPVNDERYDDYGLRKHVRDDIARRMGSRDVFSTVVTTYYDRLVNLFRIIDQGDPSLGLPPYNGGLFALGASPLLEQARLPDATIAPIIHTLSHTQGREGRRHFVNYRDMSVQQLGSIYERLLEQEPIRNGDGKISIRPNPYARKDSGSFFTPQELVDLIVERTLKPLAEERLKAFEDEAERLSGDGRPQDQRKVEWFATRARKVALLPRAAERRAAIRRLREKGDPLAVEFDAAKKRADDLGKLVRKSGHYPLLGSGDINLYSLFVEQAMGLIKPDGLVGLLTPSGIYADKTAARFFKSVSTSGRVSGVFDFENKKIFFKDIHASFKFCALIFGGKERRFDQTECAFFLHDTKTIHDKDRCFPLTPADFSRVNPNTGTAPVFRTRRDADITRRIYERNPVLVDRSSGREVKAWPVKYTNMFHMTNDSGLFRTRKDLEEKEGAWPIGNNRFDSSSGEWVPLYEGKMVQAFDHRAAKVVVNPKLQHRPRQPISATPEEHQDPCWSPSPQSWVLEKDTGISGTPFVLGFKHVTSPTNVRSMIATLIPAVGAGNSLPLLLATNGPTAGAFASIVANLNSVPLDYVVRQKVQGQNLNWFVVEQLPVIPLDRYDDTSYGPKTAGQIVREAVLELTYTAHDMAPFARDLEHVDETGQVKPPFIWNEDRRLHLRSKLDAVFFRLYGVKNREDVHYIYSTFPIVERQEMKAHGRYYTRDLCLAWMNALAAGKPDAEIQLVDQ